MAAAFRQLCDLMLSRRSICLFTEQEVSYEHIIKILEAAVAARWESRQPRLVLRQLPVRPRWHSLSRFWKITLKSGGCFQARSICAAGFYEQE